MFEVTSTERKPFALFYSLSEQITHQFTYRGMGLTLVQSWHSLIGTTKIVKETEKKNCQG